MTSQNTAQEQPSRDSLQLIVEYAPIVKVIIKMHF